MMVKILELIYLKIIKVFSNKINNLNLIQNMNQILKIMTTVYMYYKRLIKKKYFI